MIYIFCLVNLGLLLWTGNSAGPFNSGPITCIPMLIGAVLLLIGTISPEQVFIFRAGIGFAMFGLFSRGWDLILFNSPLGVQVFGLLVYGWIATSLALLAILSPDRQ